MKKIIILFLMLSFTVLNGMKLTLEEAVNTALNNSHTSQQDRININKVKSNYKTSLWNIAPDGSVSYNWSRANGVSSDGAGLSISKSIDATLPDYFNWKTAKHNIEISKLNSIQTRKSIAWNVLNSYVDLLLNQKKLEVYEDNYLVQLDILEETKILKEQGRKTLYELNQVEINALNSQLNLLDAQKSVKEKILDFTLLLNIEADSLQLADIELAIEPAYSFDIEQEKSYSIIINELNIAHNELLLFQDKLRFLPDLSLSWSYSSNSMPNEPFEFDSYQDGSRWSALISYPLLNIFKQSESHYRQKEDLRSLQIDLDLQVKEFQTSYRNLVSDLENLMLRKEINDRILDQAEQNFEIAKTNFNLGIIKTIELEQSKTELRESELNNIDIQYQIYLQQQAINHLLSKKIANKW